MLVFVAFVYALAAWTPAEARSCLDERRAAQEHYQQRISETSNETGDLYFYVPECDPITEKWSGLQIDSNNMRWCVDEDSGEKISKESDQLADCAGCLASRLVIELGLERAGKARATVNNVFLPECQDEFPELYEEQQCWNGYFNACWCVDVNTGHALSYPVENQVNCKPRHRHHHREVKWCQVLESLTTSYYEVYEFVKLFKSEENNKPENVKPEVTVQIHCDEDGNFAGEQCVGDDCWCVSPYGALDEGCARHRAKRDLYTICQANRIQQLQAYYEFVAMGVMLEHFTIPKCTQLGGWDTIQCSNQTVSGEKVCWCVDQITGIKTTSASRDLQSCDTCHANRLKAVQAGITDYVPLCDMSGKHYMVIQCSTPDDCWCVDHVTGDLLAGEFGVAVTGEMCEMLDKAHHAKSNRH